MLVLLFYLSIINLYLHNTHTTAIFTVIFPVNNTNYYYLETERLQFYIIIN